MARRDLSGAVDFGYLETYTMNDAGIIDEVLGLFQQQAELWQPLLEVGHPGWRDAAHTLKGAAAGIGANVLSEAASVAEKCDETVAPACLEAVKNALGDALMDVAAYRHEMQLRALKG
jgi:HPt (histidine-containing phosphotransfer) domain-containing protein